MSAINPYQDIETRRQYRNQTETQKRNISALKEGVVVNSLIKETKETPNIGNMYDNLIIPEKITHTDSFFKQENKKEETKSLKPLLVATTALFGILAGSMAILSKAATHKTILPNWKTLPEIPKNVAINNEPHFVTYLMIKDPNVKNVMGALGVFVLSAIGLAGKNFVDGVKEILVRKKQADVQKELQEKLIAVETQSFSGKMQILRNMLSEKAKELDTILHKQNIGNENTTFKKFISPNMSSKLLPITNNQHWLSFSGNKQDTEKTNNKKTLTTGISIAIATGLTAMFGLLAFRYLQLTARTYETFRKNMEQKIKDMIINNNSWDDESLKKVKNIMVSMNFAPKEIEKTLSKAQNLPKNYINEVLVEAEKITQEGAEAIAGKPGTKPSFYSHTDDDRAHLYNMIVNWENPLLKILFAGLSTVTTVGYVGTAAIEGIKETQVIKENAKTELDLQKRLVSVELKNFETKKRSVIEPLVEEFRVQAMHGKDKNELKTRAENILYEIKNGPPFVYS